MFRFAVRLNIQYRFKMIKRHFITRTSHFSIKRLGTVEHKTRHFSMLNYKFKTYRSYKRLKINLLVLYSVIDN